jgi:pimeloyl-ACP methyl ester carboxylesterase
VRAGARRPIRPDDNRPMARPTIVFSHGNGFPAPTYRLLFEAWRAQGFRVLALDKFGHDPEFPVGNNWSRLRDQLAGFIESKARGPAFLVGHSLGGLLSLMVACRRPELASGLVLLDSPIVTGWRAHSLQMAKLTGLMPRVSPGRLTRTRRHEWPSRQAARAHFAAKANFARWDPRVLDDYIAAGMRRVAGKTVLAFDRDIETRIYNTVPHNLGRLLERHPPRCPLGFIAGTRSVEMRQGGSETARALAGERYRQIAGTHMFPMEQPQLTAAMVAELIASMAGAAPRCRPGRPAPG